MSVRYNEDFKLEVVKAYMAGDRSTAELSAEYNVAKSTILDWAKKYSDECHYKNTTSKNSEADAAKEIRRLNQQLKEKDKEAETLPASVGEAENAEIRNRPNSSKGLLELVG